MRIERVAGLTDDQATAVRKLVADSTTVAGVRPLSDRAMLRLTSTDGGHVLAWTDTGLAGYAQLSDGGSPEVELAAVDPAPAAQLVAALRGRVDGALQIWARGRRSPLHDVLRGDGFRADRVVLQLRRPLDEPSGEPEWPPDVTIRAFRVGRDEDGWLAVNNRAFADHPDQANWTRADISSREKESWFDPAGFFLAERGDQIVGFHWTKVHEPQQPTQQPVGEVYVIGVDPSMQGQRLGQALLLHGLRYLTERRLPAAILFVEETNTVARRMYERLGFEEADADSRYLQTT